MYICPTCGKQYDTEDILVKHYSECWREKNPTHKSKSAPRTENIEVRKDNQEILDFFNSFR